MNLKQALIDNDSIRLGLEAKDWKEAVIRFRWFR